MGLFDDPIQYHERRPREGVDGQRLTYVLNRQCALCEHATLEIQWLCTCCMGIERSGGACGGEEGGRNEADISRPLLPPHWPRHARIVLETTVRKEASDTP